MCAPDVVAYPLPQATLFSAHAAFSVTASKIGLKKPGRVDLSCAEEGSRRRRGDLGLSLSKGRNLQPKSRQNDKGWQHPSQSLAFRVMMGTETATVVGMASRRYVILLALVAASPFFLLPAQNAAGRERPAADGDGGGIFFGVSDEVARSLVYERVLGSGSYKTVYLVSSSSSPSGRRRYALAVERLRDKGNAREAFNGIEIAEDLAERLGDSHGGLFERVEGWWMQLGGVQEFADGAPVFESLEGRSRKLPGRFLGSKYLVALKPVYDMDLKTFASAAPPPAPVGGPWEEGSVAATTGSVVMDEASAARLALELCTAGRVMHEAVGFTPPTPPPPPPSPLSNKMVVPSHPLITSQGTWVQSCLSFLLVVERQL